MKGILVALLAVALIIVGSWKIFGTPPEAALISGRAALGLGILEIIAGSLLAFAPTWRSRVCFGVICLCLVGVAVKFAYPDQPCGCIGSLGGRDYFLAVGGFGVLSSGYLAIGGGKKRASGPSASRSR